MRGPESDGVYDSEDSVDRTVSEEHEEENDERDKDRRL